MKQASTIASQVDQLFLGISIVLLLVFFGILATMIYLGIKYRAGNEIDRSRPPRMNLKLELSWTLPTLIIFGVFFILGLNLYTKSREEKNFDEEIFVMAKQWMWKFQYANGRRDVDELHIPIGKKIKLTMISEDVIHSFFIPDFRIKQDLLPGKYTSVIIEAKTPGVYPLLCTQYCGVKHAGMLAQVYVDDKDSYEHWKNARGTFVSVDVHTKNKVQEGKSLFNQKGCSSCHATEATEEEMLGPPLYNLYGSTVTLEDGRKITADENYIHDAVYLPNKEIVKGYKPLMSTFKDILTEDEFRKILSYIQSLRTGKTP
jgi:cytochrome c oxidase subunit 2